MRPATSVIFFTAASGAGYGLLALLGLANAARSLPTGPWFGAVAIGLALALVTGGLVSSAAHLGHPERAWRAVSQVGSSWLSREGVAALATYVPAVLFGLGWIGPGPATGWVVVMGLLSALCAVVTVFATGQIYATLKPIRRWHNGWVTPLYLAFAGATGALWLVPLLYAFGGATPGLASLAPALVLVAWFLKRGYWRFVDQETGAATAASALGLPHGTPVRVLDPPHTEDNYLLKEMAYRLARKHARKLRGHAYLFGFGLPLILSLGLIALPPLGAGLAALIAALSGTVGVLIERWLFFAEARHTVTLYYGAEAA